MLETTSKIRINDLTTDSLMEFYYNIRGHKIIEAREYDGICYVRQDTSKRENMSSGTFHIGDFMTIEGSNMSLHVNYVGDIKQMPIWDFLLEKNSPITQYINDSNIVVDLKLEMTAPLNRFSSPISSQKVLRFISVRKTLLSDEMSVTKQIITLASFVRCFFGELSTNNIYEDDIANLNEVINYTKHIDDLSIILDQVDENKHIPMKSPCLKKYISSKHTGYAFHRFAFGFPIFKAGNFRVFSRLPELQILHIASTYRSNKLN